MGRLTCVGVAVLCVAGCTVSRLDFPGNTVRMTIIQRDTKPIPGSKNTLKVRLGDITEGQVLLSIHGMYDKVVVDTVSVHPGDVVPFQVGENKYHLTVIELRNLFVGDDFAVFEVSAAPPSDNDMESP